MPNTKGEVTIEVKTEGEEFASARLLGFKKTVEDVLTAVRALADEIDRLNGSLSAIANNQTFWKFAKKGKANGM